MVSHYLITLNLFPSVPPSTNLDDLRQQRISTRLFILLLGFSLYVLVIYTSASVVVKTIIIDHPSVAKYEELYADYSPTLACPCTKITTRYQTFIDVEYSLHEVCSSIYRTARWLESIANGDGSLWVSRDFRAVAPMIFLALNTTCGLVHQSISNGLSQFDSRDHLDPFVTPRRLLQARTDIYVKEFISSTTDTLLTSLRVVRDAAQINALLSARFTNYAFWYNVPLNRTIVVIEVLDDDCLCSQSSQCITNMAFYDYFTLAMLWSVPGLRVGCFAVEGLRQSTFQCLYDQTCLDQLQNQLQSESPIDVALLDASKLIRFQSNTTVGDLLSHLMVEEWVTNMNYEPYYASCQPAQCRYTITTRNDAVYIVSTVIGLVGGLVTALKLSVPRLVTLIRKQCRRQRRRQEGAFPFPGMVVFLDPQRGRGRLSRDYSLSISSLNMNRH